MDKKLLRTIYNISVLILLVIGAWLVVNHFVHFGDGEFTDNATVHTTKHSLVCFCLVVNTGFSQFLTASNAASTGMVYCLASLTPGIRRIASECPWLTPFPQKV